ncbi:glycine zipper 2TM domain-containing protein [Parasphingorhabdus sp.]
MINKVLGTFAVTAAAVSAMAFATPAEARGGYHQGYSDGYYQKIGDDRRRYRRGDYYRDDRYYDRRDRRYYREKRRYRNDRRRYRGCDRGTGGTIIGAIAGGLLGNEVSRRGNKTEGTIIGGAVGALAGRAIDGNC